MFKQQAVELLLKDSGAAGFIGAGGPREMSVKHKSNHESPPNLLFGTIEHPSTTTEGDFICPSRYRTESVFGKSAVCCSVVGI